MQVTVRLFLAFRVGRFETRALDLPDKTTVAGVVETLGLDGQQVGLVTVNNRQATLECGLASGDMVALFPLIGGG